MKNSLNRAAMGGLLLGGFLSIAYAQEFIQDLGNSTVVAEQSTETILDGLRKDEELQAEKLDRKISTTIAETIKNEPDIAIRSMGPAAARPVIKGLSGSHVSGKILLMLVRQYAWIPSGYDVPAAVRVRLDALHHLLDLVDAFVVPVAPLCTVNGAKVAVWVGPFVPN